jgi:pimeloyl-ACP methyl ester carboxylesterase
LEAPQGKELVWFEDPPHATYAEEPEIFDQEMLPVRHETYHRVGRFLWPNG